MMETAGGIKDVFESLDKASDATLHLVAPAYYLLSSKRQSRPAQSQPEQTFLKHLHKYLDDKFWTPIKALHWSSGIDPPTFRHMQFIPQITREDSDFKQRLMIDLDSWLLSEMEVVASTFTR